MGLFELHPHQVSAMAMLRAAIGSGARSPMLHLPTGAGKTVLAAHIVDGAMRKGHRIAFCVPSIGLVDQTFERFCANGIPAVDMGVMQASHPWRRPHARVQIATAQTLGRREVPLVDVVIIDEAHLRFTAYDAWMQRSDARPLFIGLSATPWARGLGKLFDQLIRPVTLSQLIADGKLSPFRVFAPSHPDLSTCRSVAGDFHEGDLGEIMGRPHLVADIVETWLARAKGLPTLCFAVNRRHARMIFDQFASVNVRVAYVDANTTREERTAIGRDLAGGAVHVVCNIGTLTTGIDWDVRCIILARPTRSEMLFVQIIGRGLRTAEGKTDCIILDHSDTHQRLGMVTDIDHDELDDGRKKTAKAKKAKERQLPLPQCCPSCAALMPVSQRLCLACGSELPSFQPVVEVDGELVEMHGIAGKPAATAPVKYTLLERLQAMPMADLQDEIEGLRMLRNYSPKWAYYTFRDITGGVPRGTAIARDPGPDLLAFARQKARAYAKSKADAQAAAPAVEVPHAAA